MRIRYEANIIDGYENSTSIQVRWAVAVARTAVGGCGIWLHIIVYYGATAGYDDFLAVESQRRDYSFAAASPNKLMTNVRWVGRLDTGLQWVVAFVCLYCPECMVLYSDDLCG